MSRPRAGDTVRIEYHPGTDPISAGTLLPGPPAVPSSVLTPGGAAPAEHGLRAEYWDNPDFEGDPVLVRIEPQVDLNRGFFDLGKGMSAASKAPHTPQQLPGRISVRWSGVFTAPSSGEYTLSLASLGSARLIVDESLLIDARHPAPVTTSSPPGAGQPVIGMVVSGLRSTSATITLAAGEQRAVTIEYRANAPEQSFFFKEGMVRWGWQPPPGTIAPSIAAAATLAHQSDVAIVVARTFESEEMDRPNLRLPNEQDVLIRAVADANPRTIVVLMSGAPVETASWEAGVPAILEAWYAGQEQGNAVARVLFGDVNLAGKLPITFRVTTPRRRSQLRHSTRVWTALCTTARASSSATEATTRSVSRRSIPLAMVSAIRPSPTTTCDRAPTR
ncbi:MAG TPA: glycoside hydrolase family 3 C-terminal domain-containing protein [Thermomicrobiales bacterium]|nr:glycoside hydrolase family 3 C-terminal domain-containing protein [Thermomicrobiales bacterium]